MEICASVSWDPKVEFERSNSINLNLILKDDKSEAQKYSGQLKRPDTTMLYLWNLCVAATKDYGNNEAYVGKIISDTKGNRVYEIPVAVTGDDLKRVIDLTHRIQKKYFIVTRNEWVTDEEYSTFYGSANGLWCIERCDYPRGDFAELLRQTVYDMEHGSPRIYRWANVPRVYLLGNKMGSDQTLAEFTEREIRPLVATIWSRETGMSEDTTILKRQYTKMAEAAERYKQEHGIDRL